MSDLRLYIGNRRYSSWSLRPYLALAASQLAFDCEVIVLDQPGTAAAIRAVNPAGRVPVLHHGALVVHDSLAICEYVAELAPAAGLWPVERARRAVARAAAAEMHAGFAALRRDMPMDLIARTPGVGHSPAALADVARVQELWRALRAEAGAGPFLFGGFTIADAMFAPVVGRFVTYGVPLDATAQAYVEAVWAVPAFVAWRAAAALEAPLPGHA
ncbi:MAG: glutathione S-transferase family protein [Kofleriaceae bacterium]